MVSELEIFPLELCELRRCAVVFRQLSVQHERAAREQSLVVEFVPLHTAQMDAFRHGPFTQKWCA